MRAYGNISPKFWIGETGKSIRGDQIAQVIALYLVTNPHANMIGIYYLPIPILLHETGCPLKGASKALQRLYEADFAYYDTQTEHVYVPEMARYQIGDHLLAGDKRIKGIIQQLKLFANTSFVKHFYEKYRDDYNLPELDFDDLEASPLQAPCKPLRSQEQEQEQEQEQDQEKKEGERVAARRRTRPPDSDALISQFRRAWDEHRSDYAAKYPNVDLSLEWLKVDDWIRRNATKASKRTNHNLFFLSWLAKAQKDYPTYRRKPEVRSTDDNFDWDEYAKEVEARESQ